MEKQKKINISEWALDDRPREKMMMKGIVSLSNAELLAILIGSGNQDETAVDLCQRILQNSENDLNKLGKCTTDELCEFKGIGEAKAISIAAALELGRRRSQSKVMHKKKIASGKDVYEYFHPIINDLPYEELWMLLLNRANKIIDRKKVSQGGVSDTIVDIRLILKPAIVSLASGIILCHNHPSGQSRPSKQDDILTLRLKEASVMLNIKLLDHIIIAEDSYYSYSDEGRL